MLRIGVQIAPRFARPGEDLADARALDAAGADSLWLDGDEDPWLLVGALAAVTGSVRLVAPLSAADADDPALPRRLATLGRLSRGRATFRAADPDVLLRAKAAGNCALVFEPGSAGGEAAALRLGCAIVLAADSPAACAAARQRLAAGGVPARGSADAAGEVPPPELWVRIALPPDRAAFRRALADYAQAGAKGLIVPQDQRLLDLLRNPDRDDDRSDLLLAQG